MIEYGFGLEPDEVVTVPDYVWEPLIGLTVGRFKTEQISKRDSRMRIYAEHPIDPTRYGFNRHPVNACDVKASFEVVTWRHSISKKVLAGNFSISELVQRNWDEFFVELFRLQHTAYYASANSTFWMKEKSS